MSEIWPEQKKHVSCIQDPPGVRLCTMTGNSTKGGKSLPMYRCTRGTTSLESFHLHLARFIPGTVMISMSSETLKQHYLRLRIFPYFFKSFKMQENQPMRWLSKLISLKGWRGGTSKGQKTVLQPRVMCAASTSR